MKSFFFNDIIHYSNFNSVFQIFPFLILARKINEKKSSLHLEVLAWCLFLQPS